MRWAEKYTLNHRIPASVARAHATPKDHGSSTKPPLSASIHPKPTLLLTSSSTSSCPYANLQPPQQRTRTMGSSWNPFSAGSPSRRSSSYRPGYASSAYSSSSRHHSSTSRYKRSPRDSYIQHLYKKLQHFLREIWRYAQRHPYKVFFMVVMPLVSGGVLHKLARQFGVNLPEMGGAGGARGGYAGSGHSNPRSGYSSASAGGGSGGYYGSQGYGRETTYSSTRSRTGGAPSNANGGGGMMAGLGNIDMEKVAGGIGGLASLASMASKFI